MANSFLRRALFALLFATLCAGIPATGVFGQGTVSTAEVGRKAPVKDRSADYPQGNVSHWLPEVKSFRLRGEVCDETSPEKIAAELGKLKAQYPDLKDPDPNQFRQLLPIQYTAVDYAFDRTRLRSLHEDRTDGGRVLSHRLAFWDGKRTETHDEYPPNHQNGFGLDSKPDYAVQPLFSYCTYLSRQPAAFWWTTPEAKKALQGSTGTPSNYIRVGDENYHGVDCHVFLLSNYAGDERDRYYVGARDGRWYGAKEGILYFPDEAAFIRNYTLAVEEFLGKKIGTGWLNSAKRAELRSLQERKKNLWCRIMYAHVAKDYVPVFEYWFSDYRDLGNGRVFPYRETMLFHERDPKTDASYIGVRRTFTVKDIAIDRPLDDSLFQERPTDGADICDRIHQPPLFYKYKPNFKPEEWQKILAAAAARDKDEKLHRERIEALIGKPVAALPDGEWINSKPLTWADLRGKIVVVKFWAIWCAPCYNEISALKYPFAEAKPAHQQGEQDGKLPIVFIGVHSTGNSREEIDKVLKKYKLAAPACIDRAEKGKSHWGKFFAQCAVDSIPTTMAVDEKGRIMALGDFGDVMEKVWLHRNTLSEKK